MKRKSLRFSCLSQDCAGFRAIADARKLASLAIGPRRNSDHSPEGRSEVRRIFVSAQCSYGGGRLFSPPQKTLCFFHAERRQVRWGGLSAPLRIETKSSEEADARPPC